MAFVLGLDFGGTKLTAGVVDGLQGNVVDRLCIPTPPDARQSLSAMLVLGQSLLSKMSPASVMGIGVSFGGLVCVDQRTVRISHHVAGWENFPLAEVLEQQFGLPAWVLNDADAAALGEHRFGAGQGVSNLLYLTVSTGIGAGIILEGDLYRGEHALAGEIGHMVLQPGGLLCPCGRHGCLEALASGRSVARQMEARLARNVASDWNKVEVTAKKVAEAAAAGDPLALAVWEEAMRWLGIGIANAANLLNPGRVVIGGGLSHAGGLLFQPVQAIVRQYALDPRLEVIPARLGDDANLVGAAVAQTA